jgi:predicted Zn-dependent peptidase
VRDQKVATQVGGFPGFPGQKYPGLFLFFAFTAPGKTNEDVEKAFNAEIERLQKELVSTEELDGVKRRVRATLLRQLSSNFMLAIQLSEAQGLTGDWRHLFREVEQINQVTPQDIQRIAKATFTRDNKTVGTIDPLETASK